MRDLCEAVMSRIVVTCMEHDPVSHAAKAMRDGRTNFVAVTDVTHRVRGVVTDRDLIVRALASGVASDTPIRAIMPGVELVTVMPEDSIETAYQKMLKAGVSRVLVTGRHGIVIGVINRSAIAKRRHSWRTGQTPAPVPSGRQRLGMAS